MNEVDEEAKQVSYQVIRDPNGNVKLECPAIGKTFAAEEISAQVLRKLVDDASKFLNDKVTKAVVTVPAYFNDAQRTATKDAGRIAGVDVLRIINEPTAASLAYGFDRKANETIFVFDLGGGTFDLSVLEVGDGVFEVLSTAGDTHLGGDDFDKRIVDWLAQDFKKTEGVDLLKDKQALQRLTETAEKAKMKLSSLSQASIRYPLLRKGDEEFVYESCTGLSAKKGSLDGDFTSYPGRDSALKGDSFLAAVARFPLEVPQYIY